MNKKLYRNESDKVIGGVASGIADYLDIDVTVVRVAFLLLFFFGGSGFLIYIILWIAVPGRIDSRFKTDYRVKETPPPPASDFYSPRRKSGRFWAGIILLVLGLYFLFHEFEVIPYWFSIGKLWPLIFIIPGILILSNSRLQRPDEKKDEFHASKSDTPTDTTTPSTGQPLSDNTPDSDHPVKDTL